MKKHYSVNSMNVSWLFVEKYINSNYPFFFVASIDSAVIKNSGFGYNQLKIRYTSQKDLNGYIVYTVSQDEENLKQFALSLSCDILFIDKNRNAISYSKNGVVLLGIFSQDLLVDYFKNEKSISFKINCEECLPKSMMLNQIKNNEAIAFICTDEKGLSGTEYKERDPDEDTVFIIMGQLIPIGDFQSYDLECQFGENLFTEVKAIYSCKEIELKNFSIALIKKFSIDYFLFKDSNNDFYQVFSNGSEKKLGKFSIHIDEYYRQLEMENFAFKIIHHNDKGRFLELNSIPSFTGYARLSKLRERYKKEKNPDIINEFIY